MAVKKGNTGIQHRREVRALMTSIDNETVKLEGARDKVKHLRAQLKIKRQSKK